MKKNQIIDKDRHSTQKEKGLEFTGIQVREVCLSQQEDTVFTCQESKVIFIIRGQIECNMEGYPLQLVQSRNMIFACVGMRCCIRAKKDTRLVLMRLGSSQVVQDSISQFYANTVIDIADKNLIVNSPKSLPILPFNNYMRGFAIGLLPCISYMNEDEFYAGIKVKELFFLLSMSYSEKDRMRFFESVDSSHEEFATFVYRNYKQATSISEFAAMSNYSLSGFEKRFRKVFKQTATQWMARRKALNIYAEICDTSKSFKVLSIEYGFSGPSHFTRFCHKYLGKSPGVIRQRKNKEEQNTFSKDYLSAKD